MPRIVTGGIKNTHAKSKYQNSRREHMKNFVYSTERYDEEASRHAAQDVIKRFRVKASLDGYIQPREMEYTNLPSDYRYLKIKFSNLRAILTSKVCNIGNQEVRIYVALRMLPRGSAEYDTFKDRKKQAKERDIIAGTPSLDWSAFEERAKEDIQEPVKSDNPALTPCENVFIASPLKVNHKLFEITIFETKEWISSVCEAGFTDYTNAANEIKNFIEEQLCSPEGWYAIEFKGQAILAYKRADDNFILAKLVDGKRDSNYDFPKSIPSDFQRGYPYTFLEDQDEWREMELDSKSNLVLSSQQVNIVSNDIRYPLFLTGRAGSGKSTLLQYLFAEVVLQYVYSKQQYGGDDADGMELKVPVYLSYSANLVNDAMKLCKTLFEKNNVYKKKIEEVDVDYRKEIQPRLNEMFYVFKDLLCDCIEKKAPGTVRKLFPNDRYVSFPKFNAMWEKKFGKIKNAARDYGPSISWHVIRTYIKGWDSEAFLTPEDYDQIGSKNQSVTPETFKIIYDNVWEKWYRNLTTRKQAPDSAADRWDDQDLAIHCLQNGYVDDRFSAIFCDESQDFTRVEIDFILCSSSFAHRSIQNVADFNKLPFVFAGDEFQTLNPTGFSWDSLSSYFTSRLCSFVGVAPQIGMIPKAEVLSENFRSTRNIVKLANRIQLLRASRFGEFSEPQRSHFSQDGNAVYCISPTDVRTLNELKDKGVILIVPANDGESVENYITDTPLSNIVTFEDGIPVGVTVLNPTQAKGLEYPNVAIFGFDTSNNSGLRMDNLIKWFDEPTDNQEKDIALKYQVSNAYVAVTRASSNLYIIDTPDRNSFWAFALNQSEDVKLEKDATELQKLMLSRLTPKNRENWPEEELGVIDYVEGIDISDENLKYMSSKEHKDDLENRAKSLRDVQLMLQAASLHKSTGNKIDEARCRAEAATFDDKYFEAAQLFETACLYDEAVENYWLEADKNLRTDCVDAIKRLKDNCHNKKVDFCIKTVAPTLRDIKVALNDMVAFLKEKIDEQAQTRAWELLIALMLQNLKARKEDGVADIPLIMKEISELSKFEISVNVKKLGSIAYDSGDFKLAIKVWDSMERTERTPEYCKAKIKVEKYPRTIEFYEGTKMPDWHEQLLRDFNKKANRAEPLTDGQMAIVCKAIKLLPDGRDVFFKYMPFMLRYAGTIEATAQVIADGQARGIQVNRDVLLAIAELRFSNLQSWERPEANYVDPEASLLFDSILEVKKMRNADFQDFLSRSLQEMPVRDFCNENYKRFARKRPVRLVFKELGKVFELAGMFLYTCQYYNWALVQTDDGELKTYFNERWIVNKERQAERDNKEITRVEAEERRETSGIGDRELPAEPTVSAEDWEKVYALYLRVSSEVRAPQPEPEAEPAASADAGTSDAAAEPKEVAATEVEKKTPAPKEEKKTAAPKAEKRTTDSKVEKKASDPKVAKQTSDGKEVRRTRISVTKTTQERVTPATPKGETPEPAPAAPATADKQTVRCGDYTIVYFPQKKDVVIKNSDEYSVRIKRGVFPEGSDFKLKGNRLYLEDEDTYTPFAIDVKDGVLTISVFDREKDTGKKFRFPV